MTRKIDEKELGKVTGGAIGVEPASPTDTLTKGTNTPPAGTGSGGGPSQSGVVENAAGTAPSSGPVDLAP